MPWSQAPSFDSSAWTMAWASRHSPAASKATARGRGSEGLPCLRVPIVKLLVFYGPLAYLPSQAQSPNDPRRDMTMPKIKHIALSTKDVEKTARFYIDVFGMKEVGKINAPNAKGYYLTDGDINLAVLDFQNDAVAGVERGRDWVGIHHIGFQVESLEAAAEKLAAAGSEPRADINAALGVGQAHHRHENVEVKYDGPDRVIVDVSETGWVGTSGFDAK